MSQSSDTLSSLYIRIASADSREKPMKVMCGDLFLLKCFIRRKKPEYNFNITILTKYYVAGSDDICFEAFSSQELHSEFISTPRHFEVNKLLTCDSFPFPSTSTQQRVYVDTLS